MKKNLFLRILCLLTALALLIACAAFAEEVAPMGAEPIEPAAAEIDFALGGEVSAPEALPEAVPMSATPELQPMEAASVPELVVTASGDITMNVGDQLQILLVDDTPASWKSGKAKVASLSETGLISALSKGKAKISIKTANKQKFTITVHVVDPYEPSAVGIAQGGEITLNVGDVLQLIPTLAPETARTTFTWKSSKAKVATVSPEGVVSALTDGTAKITVKTANKLKVTTVVHVVDPYKPSAVGIAQGGEITIAVGQSLQLTPTLAPETARTTFTWKSGKKKIATVSPEGIVTGVKVGTAKITVRTANKLKVTTLVHVVDAPAPEPVVTPVPAPVVTPEPVPLPTASPALTGDISNILGKNFNDVKPHVPDRFRYFKDNAWTNDFVLVQLNQSSTITGVSLLTDAPRDIGKYTLFDVYPGLSRYRAISLLAKHGWHPSENSTTSQHFYKYGDPNTVVYVTYIGSSVDLVAYSKYTTKISWS